MPETNSSPKSVETPVRFIERFQRNVAPIITSIYQGYAILIFALIAIFAFQYFQTPFIGAFLESTLIVNNMKASGQTPWNGRNQGLIFQDVIVGLDGAPIENFSTLTAALNAHQVGDTVQLTVRDDYGAERQVDVVLQRFPLSDRVAYMAIPFLIGFIYLGSGLWVLSLRRADSAGRTFAIFTASVALSSAGMFDVSTTNRLAYIWTFSLAMSGGALINLALIFPEEVKWVQRWPFLRWSGYVMVGILTLLALPTLYNYDRPYDYILIWQLHYFFAGVAALTFLILSTLRRFISTSPVIRQQGVVIFWGAITSFIPIMIWFFITAFERTIAFSTFLLLPLSIFPISVAYAILRYRLVNTDYFFSRAVLYAALSVTAVIGYALLVTGVSMVLGDSISATHPLLVGFMILLLALLLDPLKKRMQTLVDRVFFRGAQIYREKIQAYSRDLNPAMDLSQITALLTTNIYTSLQPSQIHVFVYDALRDAFVAASDQSGRATTDIQFAANSPLPQTLTRQKSAIYLANPTDLPESLLPEKSRILILAPQLLLPLPGRDNNIIGFVALAPRLSGEPYTHRDINYLTTLCDQTAMAVERVQVVADFERRVNEMDVLIRLAQGVNITLQFDDILELIYAQANRIISVKDFWILLYDKKANIYHYAFYLEDDRRNLAYENQPISTEIDLAQTVIRSGQAMAITDYERETRSRGIHSLISGLYAWVGVPLNAGADTIGAMSMASRNPSVQYSSEQVDLLKAISDQAAGAIVKARLLEESERKTRQLSLLNEVSRNLTSMLDLPVLLDQILQNAMDIIGCEAGTLFLVDEPTGDLIFEVVKGPVANELLGSRLPAKTGHVGRSVEMAEPLIVNAARQTTEWSRRPDQKTGFKTRDLLMVPMFANNRVIGVIELINRKDQLPFMQDDQELLAAFTSQATIALQNARLYTQTDEALEERIEELSVMQRIDRELNVSLDINRSMQITLDWAMRRSGADAGLVGAVFDEGVQIMAHQGYTGELEAYRDAFLPIELPGLRQAVDREQTQQLRRSEFERTANNEFFLLTDAKSQIIIPIRREEQVIGVLMLEMLTDDPWLDTTKDFLSRLSDHAAIAIANAQLFTQVQEADIAKSEFVSFVSHELKTPMTSIRGYTDLLISKVVGPINENQEEFLGTIRANVTRMATLVSDLADVSRIESGRMKLEFSAVDIQDVTSEVVRSQAHLIQEKQQTVKSEIPADISKAWGDRTRIGQVLTNLLSNAYKYTPENGEITIRAAEAQNQWDPDGAPQVMLISVEDTGIGMQPEDQAQIFTKFFRSADPQAREAPGTGLGLNITRYLVEMQGGKIWFESEYQKGTTFFFTVPLADV